jgi:hypothetical protein
MSVRPVYGLLAEFESPTRLLDATRCVRHAGYEKLEAFTPIPVEGLRDALGPKRVWLPLLVLMAGIGGAAGGYFMQYYTNVLDYPINVGGRPLHRWPAFLVITFELAILAAALAAVVGMLVLNGLPMPYHPVFNVERFALASRDRFFLCVRATDPKYDPDETRRFLVDQQARQVWEVPE